MRKILSALFSNLQEGARGGLLFWALLATTCLWAHNFEVDGIYYNYLDGNNVEVTYLGYYGNNYDNEYSGAVTIPASITYNGATYSVTSIRGEAFEDCFSLTSVTIPNSVTSIGSSAFYNCSSLTSITIPESVTSIGFVAFYNCIFAKENFVNNSVLDAEENDYWGARIVDTEIEGLLIRNDTVIDCRPNVTSVIIPNSVTSIGDNAFYDCSSLTSVTIGNSVTSIGDDAFLGCSSLTSVTINSDAIVNKAYSSSSNISDIFGSQVTKYIIGDEVTSIGDWAFSGCSKLTSVTIPNSVTSIGYAAFYNCSSLTSITIPESVTSIGEGVFYGCSSLTSVTIGNSVTSIGSSAFRNCTALTSITIPNSVTSIGDAAFYECSSLTSIIIPNSVTSIGELVFAYCSNLTSVTIPNSVTSIGDRAFSGCSSLPVENNLRYADTYLVEAVDETLSTYSIKEGTKWIGNSAFDWCTSLTSITIPNSVTSIGYEAFHYCSSLTSVTINSDAIVNKAYSSSDNISHIFGSQVTKYIIGNEVTGIGDNAFYYCSKLTSVTIPNSVTSIGDDAFYGCSKLTSVTINSDAIVNKAYSSSSNISRIFGSQVTKYIIGDEVTSIGDFAFHDCSSLTSITIPNSVTSIGESAFYDCSSLTSVTIPNSVTSIGEGAFEDCSGLTKTNYAGDIAGWCDIKFGNHAANPMNYSHNFYINDVEIKDLVIPNSVDSIHNHAFYRCSSLTSITIPESVTSIGDGAFSDCSGLTKTNYAGDIAGWCDIKFGNYAANPMNYSHNFYINDVEIKDLVIPNSVDSIHNHAFYRCSSLTSITIPNNVTSIGDAAFYECSSLTSVTIPNSVTSIGSSAFSGCYKLISIRCEATTPPTIEAYTFYGVSKSIPVYVPAGCAEVYNAAYGWNEFINIVVYTIQVYTSNSQMGTAKVDYNNYFSSQISATANHGYHFVQWSDGNTDNPRTLVLTQDTILTAEFAQSFSGQCGDSLYWELVDTTLHITGSGAMYDYTPNAAPWTLIRNSIKSITVAEGVTKIGNNAFDGCTALESVVWNAKNCADASSLETAPFNNIGSQIKSFTFGEAVEHIPAYLCYGMEKLTNIVLFNKTKTIGTSAFEGCAKLGKLTLGTAMENIDVNAFAECNRLYHIYCYPTYPPVADQSSFSNYNVYLHVPCDYIEEYDLDIFWGDFKYIECMGAESEPINPDTVIVIPGTNDVTITWPTEENAYHYIIEIKKDGVVFCTLTFNADGQLLNIAFAPSRDGNNRPALYAEQVINGGLCFTVTGLEEGTNYSYDVITTDQQNQEISTHSGEFTTKGGTTTNLSNLSTLQGEAEGGLNTQKLLHNGKLLIIRDGKTYSVMGQEIE